MQLRTAVEVVFRQLATAISRLREDGYARPLQTLSQETVGRHTRHILEMFHCIEEGLLTGTVDYESRKRDARIETDRDYALSELARIPSALADGDPDLRLEGSYLDGAEARISFRTNYRREVLYALEHAIHHMAILRIGLSELGLEGLPEGFGVASATLKQQRHVHG